MEHWFTVETDGTLTKAMELFKQLKIWNFDLIWKKWHYIENYWTLICMKKNTDNNKTFTMEKIMVMYQKLLNFD